jgi:ActR/RegA family two-component response regulator
MIPRVLVIDDDALFADELLLILAQEGYEAEIATSTERAREHLRGAHWDVVLLDQRLRGPHGPDDGLDLLPEVSRLCPGARTFIVTGFAHPGLVVEAFRLGAVDYIEKNDILEPILRARLRNLTEGQAERRLGQEADPQAALLACWASTQGEADPHRRGRLLEELMKRLFQGIPGFARVEARVRSRTGEIDLVLENHSPDPFWFHFGPFLIVECKSWTAKVGSPEVHALRGKMVAYGGRAGVALLVAPGGFTSAAEPATREGRVHTLIGLIGREELVALVEAGPVRRLELLGEALRRASLGA